MAMTKWIVGNWKMNGLLADSRERTQKLVLAAKTTPSLPFEMVLCPPATMISSVSEVLKSSAIKWGGQDCHDQPSGAYTGNIAASMLKDLGCSHVILGHSERRQQLGETSETIAAKAKAAHASGLIAIICVGELDSERTAGKANDIVSGQLTASIPETATAENTVIAYEPVWAIGTGKTASNDDIKNMHAFIRAKVEGKIKNGGRVPLLYGGSVKGSNAGEILHLPNVDGVLVGGASLKADEFWSIAQASV